MTHPFEKAGLGKAPFSCTGVSENVWDNGDGTTKGGGVCDYCGTGIRWEFWIKGSIAGARQFKVGCDCVAKTGRGIENFEKVRADHTRARRQEGAEKRAEKKREARKAWIDEQHAARAIERAAATEAWRKENSALAARLDAYTGENDFLRSMIERLGYWGTLSEKQTEATESCFATIDRKEATRLTSEYIGNVGDKVTLTITIDRIVKIEGYYGTNYINIARDEQGNVLTYKGLTDIGLKGETKTIKASVKEHTLYDGVKQTIIQRPKVVEVALG